MKNTKKINIVMFTAISVICITFVGPIITSSNAASSSASSAFIVSNEDNEVVPNESDVVQNFTSGLKAVQFAQEKIENQVNYTSTLITNVKVDVPNVPFSILARVDSITKVDKYGNIFSEDVENTTNGDFNAAYALQCYLSKNNEKVFTRGADGFSGFNPVYKTGYTQRTREAATEKYGYMDNSNIFIINSDTVKRIKDFTKNDDGSYAVELSLNEKACEAVSIKLKSSAGLSSLPVFGNITVNYNIDKYGNFTSNSYTISGVAEKRIDWSFIHATIKVGVETTMTQSYGNNSDNSFKIPSSIDL